MVTTTDNPVPLSIQQTLVYHWIAIYDDDQALPQFDPETGVENRFAEVDQARLKSFGWYPFTHQLAEKVNQQFQIHNTALHAEPRALPYYSVDLEPGQKLITYRRGHLSYVGRPEHKYVYLLGHGDKEGDCTILYIYEDGHAILSNDFNRRFGR